MLRLRSMRHKRSSLRVQRREDIDFFGHSASARSLELYARIIEATK